ncbi:DUF3127 domain-containing protein [uncultured Sunxiuqinia sp.]|uniref:DUF3127 domain-containing protein n=1 Tax=Sunxiuqinia rutila TaxID=1397841 RepID=UPI0026050E43|nr:DUF3127 domain-containing protein [uncultured Sunxiuqinia sp.]
MSLEVKGKINQILDVSSGVSKAGKDWKKQEFVIEVVDGQFPKQICFTLFNDKISLLEGLNTGEDVNVSFSVESREFNGRWYHNINAWRIDRLAANGAPDMLPPEFTPDDIPPESNNQDDLPF